MMKKGNSRKHLSYQNGAKKGQIGNKASSNPQSHSTRLPMIGTFERDKLFKFAQKCSNFNFAVASFLRLVPMGKDKTGKLYLLPMRKRILHYLAITVFLASMFHRLWGTIYLIATSEKIGIEIFLSSSLFMVTFVGVSYGLVPMLFYHDTILTFNALPAILTCVAREDEIITPFDDLSVALKAIATTFLTCAIAFAVALISTVFPMLPSNVLYLVDCTGILPANAPMALWQLLFFPVEYILDEMAMICSIYYGLGMQIGIGVHKIYAIKLRRLVKAMDMRSREAIERQYVHLQLFNRIFDIWWQGVYPPGLLSVAISVIITFYVTIRHTDLPWFVYIFFPYCGVTCLAFIFWVAYDVVSVQREAEAILGLLQSTSEPNFSSLGREERVAMVKRAKAMRPLAFNVGNFNEFSLSVPLGAWDEILNQLLFLLTL